MFERTLERVSTRVSVLKDFFEELIKPKLYFGEDPKVLKRNLKKNGCPYNHCGGSRGGPKMWQHTKCRPYKLPGEH